MVIVSEMPSNREEVMEEGGEVVEGVGAAGTEASVVTTIEQACKDCESMQ